MEVSGLIASTSGQPCPPTGLLASRATTQLSRAPSQRYQGMEMRLCSNSLNRLSSIAHARKVSTERSTPAPPPANGDDRWVPETDPDYLASINELCNSAVRAMLNGDRAELLRFRDQLDEAGAVLARESVGGGDEDEEGGGGPPQALLLCYVLYKVSDHVLPPEVDQLEGIYSDAFMRIFALLEDSGWQLSPEGEKQGAGNVGGAGGPDLIDPDLMQTPLERL